jgi:NAD(P)-dependent dehydrogenase (short-subunit alcohol dehydrogenase family)
MNFKNKHAIVTGGANGIGRCIAETFLREGAAVSVIDADKEAGEEVNGAVFYHGNISEKTVLKAFVNSLKQPVNFLINNACISRRGLLSGCSLLLTSLYKLSKIM